MNITEIIIDVISTALATALFCLIHMGISWISTKVKSEKIKLALQEFETVLVDGVGYVEQSYVRVAKEGNFWDADAQKNALTECVNYIRNNLTEETYKILAKDKENLEDWLVAKIESQISYTK